MLMECPINQPLSVFFHLQLSYLRHMCSLIINPIYSSYIPYGFFLPLMLALTSSVIYLLATFPPPSHNLLLPSCCSSQTYSQTPSHSSVCQTLPIPVCSDIFFCAFFFRCPIIYHQFIVRFPIGLDFPLITLPCYWC